MFLARQFQPCLTIDSMSGKRGFQPISYLILAGSAYSAGGSPGRAALICTGSGRPETFLTTSTISSTVYGWPLPTL